MRRVTSLTSGSCDQYCRWAKRGRRFPWSQVDAGEMGVPVSKERAAGTAGPCAKAQSSALDVSQMWDTIHSLSPVKVANSSVPLVRTGWTTVRVFVSSTFEDFNSERELLVKQVFPALREWCEARNMCLVECDLRWGIPQDTPSGKILATCLGELDRCHQDTMGKPFMVILLGQRAGWIPGIDEVPQGIVEQYSWVNGMSVTGTEILHGAYRSCNANAAFCLREPSFLEKLCPQDLPRYEDKGWSALMLQSLKDQVCKRFPEEQILKYDCQVLGTDASTGVDKVKLGFSEDFSSWILHFLQSRILQTFPEHGQILSGRQELSWDQMESAQHELFLWQKHQVFLGREIEVQRILEFLQMKENDLHDRAVEDHRIPPYQIISEPGLGKSSLVTECIIRALPSSGITCHPQLANCTLFYHFVGCCSSSVQLSNIAMRLCCQLMPAGQECNAALERLKNCWRNEEIKDIVKGLFSVASVSQEKTLYIFIDAINQLSVLKDASDFLSWLSEEDFLPPFCRCVISSTPYSFSPDSTYIMQLEPLPSESAQNLVVMYLSRYTKKLSPKQLHLLLQKPSSQNPLWLTMACEELRVFGEFKMVTKKITSLPDTLQGLLENIIQRLVHEDKTTSVEKLLCLMYCCSESVTEVDLQGSMSYFESEIPRLHWASLRRTLNCLLRVGRDHRGRDTLSFFHGSVAKAVEQSFLTSDSSRHPYFSSLTYYYENVCPDDSSVVTKLPRLLKEAQFNDRLVQFLRKDQRAKSIQAHVRAHYLKGLRCSQVCREGFPRMPALVCHMCCLKTGAFGQLFLNKDSCAVCGSHAAYMSKEAFQCPQHYRIGRNCCIVCESPILAPLSPSPALLCNHCGFFPTCISIQTFKKG